MLYLYSVKRFLPYIKNKFILATCIFLVYALFLDENDIFTIITEKRKLSKLEELKSETQSNLDEANKTLARLKHLSEVERFAREKKFFKKDDEDVFVIFYE